MRKFLTALGIFVVGTSFGQTTDAELWVGAGLSADINKKFNLSYEMQGRFYKMRRRLKRTTTNYLGAINYQNLLMLGWLIGLVDEIKKRILARITGCV